MSKKNLLVVYTTERDRRELRTDFFQRHYNIFFQEYDDSILDRILCGCLDNTPEPNYFAPPESISRLINFCKANDIHGLLSTDDYPGSVFASIIAHHLQLPGASPESVLTCQHKFYSRIAQQQIVPEATPEFHLIDPVKFSGIDFKLPFPTFVKPVKSYFSIFAEKVLNEAELENVVTKSLPPKLFLDQINWFLSNYTSFDLNADYLIAEELLTGFQVTLEGFVSNKQIKILGIVDSIMYPGTYSFERFVYPSRLSAAVQQRMIEIAQQFILGIGFDNAFFNIEFMYNSENERIHIIEINPRMCSQFADLYEKVDGNNSYQALALLSLGENPTLKHRAGNYNIAASFVLRRFDNKRVARIPSEDNLAEFHNTFPEGRLELPVQEGEYLGSIMQDGKSYRYLLIHLGGADEQELLTQFELSKKLLPFEFAD